MKSFSKKLFTRLYSFGQDLQYYFNNKLTVYVLMFIKFYYGLKSKYSNKKV